MTLFRTHKTATSQTSRLADLDGSLLTKPLRIRFSFFVDAVGMSQLGPASVFSKMKVGAKCRLTQKEDCLEDIS